MSEGEWRMKGKKESVNRKHRPGMTSEDELLLLKLILDDHPRLRDRIIRFMENYFESSSGEKSEFGNRSGRR